MKKVRILAIICAVIAAVGLFVVLQKVDQKEEETVNVVVAACDVAQNTIITEEVLELKAVPEDMVLEGSYSKTDDLIGKMARTDMKAGEQVIADRLSDIGDRGGSNLAMLVEEGKRAISIAVNEATGLGNMLHPGDMVDVIAHVENQKKDGTTEMVSVTVTENVPVLAVDNVMSSEGKSEAYTTVTLMVTPDQANMIDWSENRGVLRIVLRTPLDEEPSDSRTVSSSHIGKIK